MDYRTANSSMMTAKIKAYTIFELVLAMLLAVVVIGMAYTAYSIFCRIQKNYSGYVDRNTELLVFKKLIYNDLDQSSAVVLADSSMVLKGLANEPEIRYEIHPQFMVRVSMIRDTFHLKDLTVTASFENETRINGPIDLLTLRFEHAHAPFVMSIAKLYTSVELFQFNQEEL